MSDKYDGLPPAMAEILKQDDVIKDLRHQLQQAEARVAELEPIVEELANDLESEIEARRPGELDRRIERDLIVIKNGEAFILRKQAEAVDASKSLFSIIKII